jgi:hypothetical protein
LPHARILGEVANANDTNHDRDNIEDGADCSADIIVDTEDSCESDEAVDGGCGRHLCNG